ncbi:hypothetical protein GGR42_000277 [Saonia flava]|uniref:Uncharacterized protein n=1 Tax=Saonia flava TaxID=523696 RepID=A0A846QW62_9FLAO|nr:hypothetical protein [Saonia flava]NJB69815.1 hypothetical protein [Saonia flava]
MKKLLLSIITIFALSTVIMGCRDPKTTEEKVEDGIEEVGDDLEEGVEEIEDEIDDATDDNS